MDPALARDGGLSYLEIPAVEIRKSALFYQKVLGFKLRDKRRDPSRFSDRTGHLIGRFTTERAANRKAGFLPYFYVERMAAAITAAPKLGGEIKRAPYAEGNLRVAVLRDPAGNMLGIWKTADPS
ncbi:MAG TPA: VOC family protein [Tepidisphaeraceae bacterium]|nr:VOC family protein [Tepidisphaeraceae bacterium]